MRSIVLALAACVALPAVGCGKPPIRKYEDMVDAQQAALQLYGKKPDPERLALVKEKIGSPHETKGDVMTWYGTSTLDKVPKCYSLEISGTDGSKSLGFSMPDAAPEKCGLK